jgi:hypothetical protein
LSGLLPWRLNRTEGYSGETTREGVVIILPGTLLSRARC